MFAIRRLPARTARASCTQCLRSLSTSSRRPPSHLPSPQHSTRHASRLPQCSASFLSTSRGYASKSTADELIEAITEQYGTARDEFEIATEETDRKTVYAAEDRAAAREELDKLKAMYQEALEGENGEEIKRRIGQRIRELDAGVVELERRALED